ncbi:MAG: TVP38/TMEM64 family protein [Bacilli bacterium]
MIRARMGKKRVAILVAAALLSVAVFFYLDQHNLLSNAIQRWGTFGVGAGILLMALICMTPVPSEGLLLILLKVYGVWLGLLYAWIGSSASAVAIFAIARVVGRPLMETLIDPAKLRKVEKFASRKGTAGLLVARLLPVPAMLVNYTVGMLPSVSFIVYLWTAMVAIMPYYASTALLYEGVMAGAQSWLFTGLAAIAVLTAVGFLLNRRYVRRL